MLSQKSLKRLQGLYFAFFGTVLIILEEIPKTRSTDYSVVGYFYVSRFFVASVRRL